MKNNTIKQTDSREFFRIDDKLCFDYFTIPSNTANESVPDEEIQERLFTPEEYHHFRLIRQLYEIDNESNAYLSEITRTQPEVTRYLECVSQKFNLLAQSLYQQYASTPRQVNLSIGGLAFQSSEEIPEDTRLKTKLVFYPSGLGIVGTLKVLRNQHLPARDKEQPYLVCGQFIGLSAIDEQIIHQHILQKQVIST